MGAPYIYDISRLRVNGHYIKWYHLSVHLQRNSLNFYRNEKCVERNYLIKSTQQNLFYKDNRPSALKKSSSPKKKVSNPKFYYLVYCCPPLGPVLSHKYPVVHFHQPYFTLISHPHALLSVCLFHSFSPHQHPV